MQSRDWNFEVEFDIVCQNRPEYSVTLVSFSADQPKAVF
jgi:hypothetical protein